jgi:ribonuclease HI
MHLDIYTDGSCLDNGRVSARGGWAFAVTKKDTDQVLFEDSGKLRPDKQTNNRAEAEAVLYALLWIESQDGNSLYNYYTIWSDSQYVIDCITGIGTRSANRDIWSDIENLCQRVVGKFEIKHVDSHMVNSDCIQHIMNLYTDRLARIAANNLTIMAKKPII